MFDRDMRRLDIWDLGLTKLPVACFMLGIVAASPKVARQVRSVPTWLYFLAALLTAVRPIYRFFRSA